MKTKKVTIIFGESIDVIELETVKVMHGQSIVREYGDLNSIPPNFHHTIREEICTIEESTRFIVL